MHTHSAQRSLHKRMQRTNEQTQTHAYIKRWCERQYRCGTNEEERDSETETDSDECVFTVYTRVTQHTQCNSFQSRSIYVYVRAFSAEH